MLRLPYDFYHRDCPEVARDLVGKVLVYKGNPLRISETECYCGEDDTACHANKGRTKRTEVMYGKAGTSRKPLSEIEIFHRSVSLLLP